MIGLLDRAYRRRLHILASFAILGLQFCAYSALLVLWATNSLDRHLFSLSRVSLVSQVISVVSQATAISSLAGLTFFVQAVAADRVIRRPQKLAAIQDLLDAWHGIGSSAVSIWRSRRLGRRTHVQLLVVFLFFTASSILQIVVPATVTVQSTNSTIPVTLRVTQRPELTDSDLSSLGTWASETDLAATFSFLKIAVNVPIGIPPGVERGIWFDTLSSSGLETVTFTDQHAQQPAVHCVSIPRRSGDRYEISYKSYKPGSDSLHANVTSLLTIYDGAAATFSNYNGSVELPYSGDDAWWYFDHGLLYDYKFGGEKASKNDPPNSEFNDTVLYLPWSAFSDNSTRHSGNIAFVLISSRDNASGSDLEDPINQTVDLTVWSWIADSALNAGKDRIAFQENVSVTFHYWPIVCTVQLENLTAHVRGDNTLLSYSEAFNGSQPVHLPPFSRDLPSSPYERAWGPLFDEIWYDEMLQRANAQEDVHVPNWLEHQVLQLLDGTTLTQKIAALQASLRSITSVAYRLLVQHFRVNGGLTRLDTTVDVQGQQQIPVAKLHVNGLQAILGFLSVTTLFLCVHYVTEMRDGVTSRKERYIVVGDVLDFICLMRESSLPEVLAEPKRAPLTPDMRRDKAEKIDVVFGNFKLDAKDAETPVPSNSVLPDYDGRNNDAVAATERALARLSYIGQRGAHTPHSLPTLTNSRLIIALALVFLGCLHMVLAVLWGRHSLNHYYFSLSKLGIAAQATAVISQICAVGALSLLSYGLQRIAADKFIRQTQTVQDLQDTLRSLSGVASAFHALWDGFVSSQRILGSVAQLCFLWLASSVLHITMPALVSVNTTTVPTSVVVKLDTIPGNIINLGLNLTRLEDDQPFVFSQDLINVTHAVPYLWENRNALIRLPPGLNETVLFSTPLNVSSGDYVITDPYAHSLSVRCGVVQLDVGSYNFSILYHEDGITPQTFNSSFLSIEAWYQYTRPDGVTPNFSISFGFMIFPGLLQFGGEKATYNSPPNIFFRNTLFFMGRGGNWSAAAAERGSVSVFYISLKEDALSFPSGVDYAPPIKETMNVTVLSWVNDTNHSTTTLNGQPVNAFNESVTVTFFIWPLACVLIADQAMATILGNGTLESLNISSIPPHTAFPFMTNDPKNHLEGNSVPLLGAVCSTIGDAVYGIPWLQDTMQSLLNERPNITTLEDNLASIGALAYSLLFQAWRSRYASGDAALASTWVPQYATVPGEHSVLKAHLQVNGIPLLVGSLSVIVLVAISAMCVVGHGTTDSVVRDGGVIDLVSLLHNSALPEILAGHGDDGNQKIGDAMFRARRNRARRTMVAYGYGALDLPRRIQQRENEHLDALIKGAHEHSRAPSFPDEDTSLIDAQVTTEQQ